jgi:lysophospholipase L1-like esterase
VGDSTVQTWASGYYPKAGWGQVLPKFFDSTKANVVNKAVGGTSSKSFYDNYWSGVRSLIVTGDYVFVQFGINDAASDTARHTDAFTTFKDYLRKYVNETKARGGYPVIVATLRRNAWNADGTVYNAYHDYPIAARQVASEMNVPCVDLDAMCKTLMESLGQTYTTYYWYMQLAAGEWPNYSSGQADNVHFQESGALEMARLVVQGIRQSSFTSMQNLVPALRPTSTVTFNSNNPSGGVITRTQAFPSGVTVTAMARPNSGVSFLNWSGSFSSTKRIAQFTMGTAAMSITANLSGGSSGATYQGENGAVAGGAFVESTNSGYVGSGYINFPASGGSLSFNAVNGNGGGTKSLAIRYANGGTTSRTGTITVNGATSNITFNPTGAWTTWATMNLNVALNNNATNVIKFASTGQDLGNIDQITVP